jgi:hypothetical protein
VLYIYSLPSKTKCSFQFAFFLLQQYNIIYTIICTVLNKIFLWQEAELILSDIIPMEHEDIPSLEAVCPGVKVALRDEEAFVFDDALSTNYDGNSVTKTISEASDGIICLDGVISSNECSQLCYVS